MKLRIAVGGVGGEAEGQAVGEVELFAVGVGGDVACVGGGEGGDDE